MNRYFKRFNSYFKYINNWRFSIKSTTTVNTALGLKADTTTVNTALALKADTATVNTALALKADTATVNTSLGLKQNTLTSTSDVTIQDIVGRRLSFTDTNQTLTSNNTTGFNTLYNISANTSSSITCGPTGILISFDNNTSNNYIQVGAARISLHGEVYIYSPTPNKGL